MSSARTDAYVRRFPYITKLSLPRGSIDFALDIPSYDKDLIGTKAMLVARPDFHPALINLLFDAAAEIHSEQGYFEAAGEFPGTQPVDIPVSTEADRHKRFRARPAAALPAVLDRDPDRAIAHPAHPARRRPRSARAFASSISPLARSLAHLSLVRRAGTAGARRRDAPGRASDRAMAAGLEPHRELRVAHPHPAELRQRGLHLARAYRARAAARCWPRRPRRCRPPRRRRRPRRDDADSEVGIPIAQSRAHDDAAQPRAA